MGVWRTTDEQIALMRAELQKAKQKAESKRSHRFLYALGATFKATGQILFYTVVAALLVVLLGVLVAKSRGQIPSVLGYRMFVVESGSMEPTLKVGAVIVSKSPQDAKAIRTGTIITFRTADGASVITHRVIEVVSDGAGNIAYRTKGDYTNNSPDKDLVTPDRVIAVFVLKVPFT
jgi:signal peptidase I